MAASNRSYSTPNELYNEVEALSKKLGSNMNKVHNEGLKLWLKQAKKKAQKIRNVTSTNVQGEPRTNVEVSYEKRENLQVIP